MSKNIDVKLWPPFRRQGTTITQRTSGDTINSTGNLTFNASGLAINAANAIDADYLTLGARDSDTNAIVEVARLAGATDPYFATGGSQQFKFYNTGTALFGSVVTTDAATMEIGAAGVIKSGATNTDTLLIAANDTTFITLTTGDTDTMSLGTFTMSGDIAMAGYDITGVGTVSGETSATSLTLAGGTANAQRDVIISTVNAAGNTQVTRITFSSDADVATAAWNACTVDFGSNSVVNVGNAGNDFGTTNSLVGTTFSGTVDFNGNSVVNVGNAGNDFGASNSLVGTTMTGDFVLTGKQAITSTAVISGGYALQLTTTSTSTADATACTGIYNALTSSAIVIGTSPYAFTGSYSGVTKTGADTNNSSGLVYAYQGVASQTGSTDVGTRSTYGGYFSATGDANGTSTTYGVYATATGADTNWAAYLNGAVYAGGDITFVTGGAIKSGGTNGNTLLIKANDTTFITLTTGATDTCELASAVTATTQAAGNNSTLIATTAYVDTAIGTVNSLAEVLALGNTTGATDIVVSSAQGISTALVDDNYFTIKAVDNDPNTASEVARAQGAADPYFSAGGTQQFKFYNSGIATFDGAATSAAFIDISPTLTGPAATNTYAVNISPVGITIPTGTTAIAASLYVAEPIFTETGVLTLGANVYIDAAPTEGGTNYSLYVVGTSYLNGAITAPGGLTGNITGDCSGSSGTCTGNAGTVTNGVYTTDTGTVTAKMLQNAAADLGAASITIDLSNTNGAYVTNLTIDGAFSGLTYNGLTITANGTNTLNIAAGQTLTVSGSATISGALGTGAYATIADYALVGQQFYIGSTQVAINRASAALTLAGITLTTPDIGTPSAGVLTSCTGLTGTLALTANSRITFALPATDAHCTGPTIGTIASGYSSAVGDLVFYDTDSKWSEVDADAVATCNGMMGIALEAKADTEAMVVALPGSFVHIDAWNLTAGNTYYAGETLGAIQNTIPTGADAIIRVVGFAIDADTLYFMPSSDQQSVVA